MQAAEETPDVIPEFADCCYTSCYCEENVWKLCEGVRERSPQLLEEFSVIFLSNEQKMIPIWMQHGGSIGEPVIWDYHVILFRDCGDGQRFIYDLDTALSFPCPCHTYIEEALRYEHNIRKEFRRNLRIIRAEDYLRTFASDRSHMKDDKNEWKKPPPPYPCIKTPESSMNLDDFVSMDPAVGYGTVCTLEAFTERFGAPV